MLGDLHVGEPVVERQLERLALRRRERGHRRSRPLSILGVDGVLLRRRRHLDRGGTDGHLAIAVRLLATDPVDGAPMGDRHGPGADAPPLAIEAGRLPPDLDEDLLRDLLGL